ncbi:hypothetical protein MKY92_07770 [Paenibacillus sp. FSL R5-0623]|uniref:hypothetical protein n=1 Tax=Paenibacillus sp. FSL R5-0623 TaxID=2921651 RepID=UPI0030DAA0E6
MLFELIHQVIHFYINKLGNYNLVFNNMKVYWFGFISLLGLVSIAFLFIPNDYKFYGFVIYLILTIIGLNIVNIKAKKIVLTKYGLKQDERMWGGSEFNLYKENELKKYLKNELGLNLSKSCTKIIEALNKEIENTKLTIFFVPGIFVGLFIPIWNQYAITQFKNISLMSEAITVLGVNIIVIFMITYVISLLRFVMSDVVSLRRNRLKELVSLIEGIDLRSSDEDSEK